jgi:hypothetical protein
MLANMVFIEYWFSNRDCDPRYCEQTLVSSDASIFIGAHVLVSGPT